MLDDLLGQCKRLFSSKSNNGKLVHPFINKLHFYKVILIAISIAFLLGYAQFREHFACDSQDTSINNKVLANLCWLNGTTTIIAKNKEFTPHIGISFISPGTQKINHNYMRSLWMLLVMLGACSVIAQKFWSKLLEDDVIRALLKLNGFEDSPIVVKANTLNLKSRLENLRYKGLLNKNCSSPNQTKLEFESVATQPTDIIQVQEVEKNLHGHQDQSLNCKATSKILFIETELAKLDEYYLDNYHENVLLFTIMATSGSYMPGTGLNYFENLNLRSKLMRHALVSSCMSLLQILMPYGLLGPKYLDFGLRYIKALVEQSVSYETVNSVEYSFSDELWPTLTACTYNSFSLTDRERITATCVFPINEICAKVFAAIWLLTIVSLFIEIYHLLFTMIALSSKNSIAVMYGYSCWPKAVSFVQQLLENRRKLVRDKHILHARLSGIQPQSIQDPYMSESPEHTVQIPLSETGSISSEVCEKQIEAQKDKSNLRNSRKDSWRFGHLSTLGRNIRKSMNDLKIRASKSNFEDKTDSNILLVLYLLSMRLDSKARLEILFENLSNGIAVYTHAVSSFIIMNE